MVECDFGKGRGLEWDMAQGYLLTTGDIERGPLLP